MAGFLFHDIIFGPVRSRRLALSLGVNLLPTNSKYCSFNCIYCECGWTPVQSVGSPAFPERKLVSGYLEQRLKELAVEDYLPDVITYAGNGEPTLHPDFAGIVDDTIDLRNKYAPDSKVTVLSNASMLDDPEVFKALKKLDNNIQKLDAGSERIFNLVNNPVHPFKLGSVIGKLKEFNGEVIIQSMFLRGCFRDQVVDNTTDDEVAKWLDHLLVIRPKLVMIYPIARATPVHNLKKIDLVELEKIGAKVKASGIEVKVYQ